jgi:4-hydroxy-tetrahydrodipicolinate synthase
VKENRLNREELKELIQGIVVTTPTPFDDDLKLDLARTTDIVRWWVEQGLGRKGAPLKMAAAGGEGPDMTGGEWEHLLRTTVNAAGPDAVVMAAIQPKSTYHSIEDAKKAQDLGIIGLQVDLPFFHHPNQDDYVRYFTDLSDAIDIGIMIYNTHWFGAPSITPETMARLKDAEHVVAVKWAAPSDEEFDRMTEFASDFNVINNSLNYVRCHQLGGRGNISATAHANSAHDFKIWQLLEDHKYDEAQAYLDEFINTVWNPWTDASSKKSGGYRLLKAFMYAIGKPVGQTRLPTLPIEDDEIEDLKERLRKVDWPVVD